MASITLNSNIAALDAERLLGQTTARLSGTFERLSSGLRINRASEDAAGLAIAASLNVGARVFDQGVRNVNNGISYLNIADGATGALTDVLLRLRELSTQSSNGTLSDPQRQSLDMEFQALVAEYNRVLATTQFQGQAIFSAANATLTVQAGYGANGTLTANLGASGGSSSTTTTTQGDGTFAAKQDFTTGTNPKSVAFADLNGDGKLDLVTANLGSTASVLLGNGDGTFLAKQDFTTGAAPHSVAVADVNGDGKLDLVTADATGNTVSVLLGNGDGTFLAKQNFTTGISPNAVAIADVNGDGKLDLVTADATGNTVSVLLGNGNGTFLAKQDFTTGNNPGSVAIADVNGDGKLDLVTTDSSSNTVSVLLGNGNGTFLAKQDFTTGGGPQSVAVADFNGDGKLDLVTVVSTGVSVLLGNGNGTFLAKQDFTIGGNPQSVAVADFNGDGKLDLVTANSISGVSVLLGNGNGTFLAKQNFTAGSSPASVAVADFNGDGKLDLAIANITGSTVSVLLGNGNTTSTTTIPGLALAPIGGVNVATQAAALAAQGQVDGYMLAVNTVVGQIGAAMSRFEVASRVLGVSSENFRAAESRITDVDVAEESATLVKERILQQAGAAVLAQANQQPAITLQLLGR